MNNKSKYIQQNTSPKNIQKENSMSNSFISRTSYNTLPNEEDFHKSYFLKLSVIQTYKNKDIFLNAIFDYCLYTNNIKNIYDRLQAIENIILKKYEYKYIILNKNNKYEYISDISDRYKFVISTMLKYPNISEIFGYFIKNNIDYYYNPNISNKKYNIFKINFINYMKNIYILYTYTYGYNTFKKYIINIINLNNKDDILSANYLSSYKKNIISNIYSNKIKNIDVLINLYLIKLLNTKNDYYDSEFLDTFNKILFKKIKVSNNYIPRFWLNMLESNQPLYKYKFFLQKKKDKKENKKKFRENYGIYIYISLIIHDNGNCSLIIPKSQPLNINEKVLDDKKYNYSPSYSSGENL